MSQPLDPSTPPARPCVCAVMPVYNEAATVAEIVRIVLDQPCVAELIIVDDASTDGTWEALQRLTPDPRVRTFRHELNQGKGAALRTGISHATAALVIIQDADLEYDPGRLPGAHPADPRSIAPTSSSARGSMAPARTGCSITGTRSATGCLPPSRTWPPT